MPHAPSHLCRNCLSAIVPKRYTPGTFLTELFLWLFFFWLLFLPGIFYSVWRLAHRKWVCPVCESDQFVPLNSPAAVLLQPKPTA